MERELADDVVQRAAMMSVLYYPEILVDQTDYSLSADVDWCLERADLTGTDADDARDIVGRFIVDPTLHREALCGFIFGLVPEDAPQGR